MKPGRELIDALVEAFAYAEAEMTEEEIDEELLAHGLDPDEVGRKLEEVARLAALRAVGVEVGE